MTKLEMNHTWPFKKSDVAVIMALPSEGQGLFESVGAPIYYCGVGKINATFTAADLIHKTGCKVILNLGTAGSHKFKTHSLIEVSAVVQKDMDVTPLGFPLGETPMDSMKGKIQIETFFKELSHGVCGTGDVFEVGTPKLECDLVDMEAYAIAKVCKKMNVQFHAFKYITDGSDPDSHKDWVANLKPASEKLFEIYKRLVVE